MSSILVGTTAISPFKFHLKGLFADITFTLQKILMFRGDIEMHNLSLAIEEPEIFVFSYTPFRLVTLRCQ